MRISALLFFLVFVWSACSGQPNEETHPHVLLVVVDTLRQDHVGVYGYDERPTTPYLDAMMREEEHTTAYRGLLGVSSWTMPSMATLFTGMSPAEHGVMRLVGPHSELRTESTLAKSFQEAGYHTGCVTSNFLLSPKRKNGFGRGFDFYDDSVIDFNQPNRFSTAQDVVRVGNEWLESLPDDEPWFLVLHFFDPHASYEDHPEYDWFDADYGGWVKGGLSVDVLRKHAATSTDADRAQLNALYDEEIRAVDDALGFFVDGLKESGAWDQTHFIFTSDHGEELAERGHIGHTTTLFFEQVDLPYLVREPFASFAGASGAKQSPAWVTHPMGQEKIPHDLAARIGLAGFGTDPAQQTPTWAVSEVDFVPIRPEHHDKFVKKRMLRVSNRYEYHFDLNTREDAFFDLMLDPDATDNLLLHGGITEAQQSALNSAKKSMRSHSWWEAD